MANRWGNNGNSERLYFLGLQNHCGQWLEKTLAPWKKSNDKPSTVLSGSVVPDFLWPIDCSLPGSSVQGDSPGKNTGLALPNLGIEPMSPTFRADSLPCEPPGKPKNTGVGSLSLLQGISPPRIWTEISCIVGGFFTSWATREARQT